MRERNYYKRQFLNSEENGGTAFVEARVSEPEHRTFDAELKIADCSRIVSIDCDVYSDESAENVRLKVRRLAQAAAAFEKAVLAALDARERQAARR